MSLSFTPSAPLATGTSLLRTSSLGTSNRTFGATLVGAGGTRPGGGGLARVYNWCARNQPQDIMECVFGTGVGGPLWVVSVLENPYGVTNSLPFFALYYSYDGIQWQKGSQPFDNKNLSIIVNVVFCNKMWFATGLFSFVNKEDITKSNIFNLLYSYDGIHWNYNPTYFPFYKNPEISIYLTTYVISNNHVFVCLQGTLYTQKETKTNIINVSLDGISWKNPTVCPLGYYSSESAPAYGKETFVVSGQFENNKTILYSTSYDADYWQSFEMDPWSGNPRSNQYVSVLFQNNLFVSFLFRVTNEIDVYYWDGSFMSPSWTHAGTVSCLSNITSMAYQNGVWVAVGDGGIARATELDGPWTLVKSIHANGLSISTFYGNDRWVALVKGENTNYLLSSTDNAQTWSQVADSPFLGSCLSLSFDGTAWVGTGKDINQKGIMARSVNFLQWSIVSNPPVFKPEYYYTNIKSSRPGSVGTITELTIFI